MSVAQKRVLGTSAGVLIAFGMGLVALFERNVSTMLAEIGVAAVAYAGVMKRSR